MEADDYSGKEAAELHKQVPEENYWNQVVRPCDQHRTLGKDWPETSEANHPGEALEMDRPHSEETGIEHHKTGSVMEPSGETETRKTQSDMEERGRGRDEEDG